MTQISICTQQDIEFKHWQHERDRRGEASNANDDASSVVAGS